MVGGILGLFFVGWVLWYDAGAHEFDWKYVCESAGLTWVEKDLEVGKCE